MRAPTWLHRPSRLPSWIRFPRTRKGRVVLGVLATGAVAVIAVGVAYLVSRPKNTDNTHVAFKATPAPPVIKKKKIPVDTFLWPFYGYTAARTHAFGGDRDLHPPFRRGWSFAHNALLEFPPTIYGHSLYFMDDGATLKDISGVSGHQRRATGLGTLSAATPALDVKLHRMFVPTLSTKGTVPGNGGFYAVSMKTGKVLWKHALPSGSESSPVVIGDAVYFGDQAGTVYSFSTETGHLNWKIQTGEPVKGGPAYAHGVLYFGNYGGDLYAVRASNGHQLWMAGAGGGLFGGGTFYATPTVAYGRVYIGNTNGYVYSYSARNGQLAWSTGTGAYVYSAAAVQNTSGLGPTVYVGSYNGNMYALNARSGAIRWSYQSGSAISGAASLVNNVVYFSGVYDHRTVGLSARTGKKVFGFPDGAYTSVVAAPNALYLSGHYALYELLPASHHVAATATGASSAAKRRQPSNSG